MAELQIDIATKEIGDPAILVYGVRLRNQKSSEAWQETFGTKELTEAFLRGVKAAWAMGGLGYIETPVIPERG